MTKRQVMLGKDLAGLNAVRRRKMHELQPK
jgi:hypothetical protein